jgi:very-short-patch-repair endonuclease
MLKRTVWQLAERQHGVISRRQLLELGYSSWAIKHRVQKGRLHPIRRGVYAVGRPQLSRDGVWMAALLACGPGAALSHRSAAALWEIRPYRGARVDVLVPRGAYRRQLGVVVHSRAGLEAETTTRRGIPVTNPACTIVDIAPGLTRNQLEAAINEADKRDLVDPEALRAALDGMPRRPGGGVVRKVLDSETFVFTDTDLERWFLPIARRAGLPNPGTQERVNAFQVDFHWPDLGLVVETDGLRYHRTASQQTKDRIRDQVHTAAGLTPLRFTHAQIRFDPGHVEATLAAVARRLGAPSRG